MSPNKETTEFLLLHRQGLKNLKEKAKESFIMSFNLTKAIKRIDNELKRRGVKLETEEQ